MKIVYPMQLAGGDAPTEVSSLDAFIEQCHQSTGGTYLIGRNRLWHGGIHLSEKGGWHPGGAVRAMFDGEIVAYRLAREPVWATLRPEQGEPGQALDLYTSPSFCLVRHHYDAGGQPANRLTFYSLYMHIACENTYSSPDTARVTVKHSGAVTYVPIVVGEPSRVTPRLELRHGRPTENPVYAIPGAEVEILQPDPVYHLNPQNVVEAFNLVRYVAQPDALFYIAANQLNLEHPDKPGWMVSAENKPARRLLGDNTRLVQAPGALEGDLALPAGSEVVIAGESRMVAAGGGMTEFCPVRVFKTGDGTITDNKDQIIPNAKKGTKGWLLKRRLGSLLQAEPNQAIEFDKIIDRRQHPIAVKAGELIAHWGAHETANSSALGFVRNPDNKAVHVEVFVASQDRAALVRCIHHQAGDAELVSQHDWGKQGVSMLDGSSDPDGFLDKADTDGKESGEFFRSIYLHLTSAHDAEDVLSGDDIKSALADKSLAHKLRRLFIRHESEWIKRPEWKRLKAELKDKPNLYQYALDVTNNMAWIDDVAIKAILGDTQPWFIHPAGMMGLIYADCSVDDTFDFETTLGIYKISKKSAEFILSWEAYMPTPYVPVGDQSSGVTVGYGYDLGQQSRSSAQDLLSGYYAEQQVERLLAAIGKRGDQAREIVNQLADIRIEKDNALNMAMMLKKRFCQAVVDIYPQAIKLPPDSAGAILSLVYNRGSSLALSSPGDPIDRRREMREIRDDFAQGKISNIPARLRAMKRLWSNQPGLIKRREGEAALIESDLRGAVD